MSPGMSARVGGSGGAGNDSRSTRPQSYITQQMRELLPREKLAELMDEVAPGEVLDPDVEEFLQEHIDEFVESVTELGCTLAKHRKSKILEAKDIQLHLERNWNIRVPGYGEDPPQPRRNMAAPVHISRLQAIAKSQQEQGSNPEN